MGSMHPLRVLFLCIVLDLAWCQIKILSPSNLVRQFSNGGIIYGSTATFGAPFYGERVMGRLLYGESLLGHDHCTDADYVLKDSESAKDAHQVGSDEKVKLIDVVVVRRGKCSFAQKVRIAQTKHAHAVIMVDKRSSKKTPEDIQHEVIGDDGVGSMVKIPSVLITSDEGEKVLESMKLGPVLVELAWDIPRAEVVLVDFWMSSGSEESLQFLEQFKDAAETLAYRLQFVPHYHVFSLPPGSSYGHLCADASTAKHCAPDPDGPGPITGQMVVNEDLRQLCLWHISAEKSPLQDPAVKGATYSKTFWEYVVRRRGDCPLTGDDPKYRFGDECSFRLMSKLGVNLDDLAKCIKDNADLYLDAEVENVAWSPQALRLNGWRYNGPLDREAVLKAICSGFREKPQECTSLLDGHWGQLAKLIPGGAHGVSFGTLFWSVGMLLIFLAIAFYVYKSYVTTSVRKVLREEVMLEVQSQMADYSVLEDGQSSRGNQGPLSF